QKERQPRWIEHPHFARVHGVLQHAGEPVDARFELRLARTLLPALLRRAPLRHAQRMIEPEELAVLAEERELRGQQRSKLFRELPFAIEGSIEASMQLSDRGLEGLLDELFAV